MSEFVFEIQKLNKYFGPTHANRDIDLKIRRGQVHGLAGENGSGKSTLASMICGIQKPDSGEMLLDGQPYAPKSPVEANAMKVAMVVQELGVVGSLPVSMNMFLGRTGNFRSRGFVSLSRIEAAAREQMDRWGITNIPLNVTAESLSIEQRKMMELVRALSVDPDILILDEITQALSHDNRAALYKIMEKFTGEGHTIILITHDIEEMIELCDSVTVLRDGQVVDTVARDVSLTPDKLKRMMIGREINGHYYRTDTSEAYEPQVVMSVQGLNVPNKLHDVSFDLHKGEILAVCGLSDAGIHSLGSAIFGLEEHRTGHIEMGETGRAIRHSKDILSTGGAYLSKDRDSDGLMLSASIKDNIFLPSAPEVAVGPLKFVHPGRVKALAQKAAESFEIKSTGIDHITKRLSGGNKQKVNLSRWLIKDLKYIILDCPTRGVDVGVKAYIYEVMTKAKARGLSILLISDELAEAMGMADRIMVMKNGEIVRTIGRSEGFSEEAIIEVMV